MTGGHLHNEHIYTFFFIEVFILPSPYILDKLMTVLTFNRVGMVTHKGPLLELGTRWAREQHPPGPRGA